MSQSKVLQDIDSLIDLFLSPDFDPWAKSDSATNLRQFQFESEVFDETEEFDAPSFSNQAGNALRFVGCGSQSEPAPPPPHFKHDEFFTKKCGRVFAKLGDELYHGAQQQDIASELQKVVQPLENNSENIEVLNSSWESFKHVLDNYIATSEGEAPKVLGAILLTISGLSRIGSGAKSCVRNFTRRFISERGLDRDIARIGGLNGIMATKLD